MNARFPFLIPLLAIACTPAASPAAATSPAAARPDEILELRRVNLLRNSSFEWDDYENRWIRDGLAVDWSIWGDGYGLYSDRSVPSLPDAPSHGTRSQRVDLHANGTATLHLIQQVQEVRPGTPYTLSAFARLDGDRALDLAPEIAFYHGDKFLASKRGSWSAPTSFTRIVISCVAPERADRLRAIFLLKPRTPDARGSLWIDAAQLERAAVPGPFLAGYEPGPREFVSPPIPIEPGTQPYRFSWIASQPPGTHLLLHLRGAADVRALDSAPWLGPPDRDAYGNRVETGPNLLADGSCELGQSARTIGYGNNDRIFTTPGDARDGARALKVEIARHADGDGRWMIPTDQPVASDTDYALGIWHRENAASTPIHISVTIEDPDGKMHWSKFGQTREASVAWKHDTLHFRTPRQPRIARLWAQISLRGPGSILSDSYTLRRVIGSDRWPVPAGLRDARWIQWRATLATDDGGGSPRLYKVDLARGTPAPEIRWFNVLDEKGAQQRYVFLPGQCALFKPQIIDPAGADAVAQVTLTLRDPSGARRLHAPMRPAERGDDGDRCFSLPHTFPPDSPPGEWIASVEATTRSGGRCEGSVLVKIRSERPAPKTRMILGALADDYGFSRFKGQALDDLIARYRSYGGLEIWKLSVAWKRLEPFPDRFDPDVIAGIRTFIDGARDAGAKAQISIQQQNFPDWANDGAWDNEERYRHPKTSRLAHTWGRLAAEIRDRPGLDGYLLINEENAVRDADLYLRAMAKVAAATRRADPDRTHRITLRPNTRDPYLRTRIAAGGAHDMDYGSGGYPTSSSWYYRKYASPTSATSCLRMAGLRDSARAFDAPCAIGEIGFFQRQDKDAFGDEEKLLGFQRALTIAYELGMEEFQLWGTGFSFARPDLFFPRLAAFRDSLARRPRPATCDLRLVLDTGEALAVSTPPNSSELDMSKQPYAPAVRALDSRGFVWFTTTPEAMAIQPADARVTVRLSELRGKSPADQEAILTRALRGIQPSGTPLPWPD